MTPEIIFLLKVIIGLASATFALLAWLAQRTIGRVDKLENEVGEIKTNCLIYHGRKIDGQ